MKKTVVIHQPEFLPYLGFFHRLLDADLLVILDHVQYRYRYFQNRNKIKTPRGEQWITVCLKKHPLDTKINEILISKDVDWKNKNLNLIRENYRYAPFFDQIFPFMKELFSYGCERLIDFNMKSIHILNDLFDTKTDIIFSSTLNPKGNKNELLVDILKKVGGTTHLSGTGAKKYYNPKPFEDNHLEVIWQSFTHPVYPQLHGDFITNLSSIDLLFNCGIEESRKKLRNI